MEEAPSPCSFRVEELVFRSSKKLPSSSMTVLVRLHLPAPLLEAARTSGLRRYPARGIFETRKASIHRGLTAPLEGAAPFEALLAPTPRELGALLASGAELRVEVAAWERNAGEAPLGTAVVPLGILQGETWVEGSAPVMALQGDAPPVQVGALHMLLTLDAIEPPASWAGPPAPATSAHGSADGLSGAASPERAPRGSWSPPMQQQRRVSETAAECAGGDGADVARLDAAALVAHDAEAALAVGDVAAVGAWDAGAWREEQEALVATEAATAAQQRLGVIGTEWGAQSARRGGEVADALAALRGAEASLAQDLATLEAREASVAAAEEAAAAQGEAQARAAERRRRDGEAAVRRLQAELQQSLDLERARTAEAAAARDAAADAAAAARREAEEARLAVRAWREAESASERTELAHAVEAARARLAEEEAAVAAAVARKRSFRDDAAAAAAELVAAQEATAAARREGDAWLRSLVSQRVLQQAASEHGSFLAAQQGALRTMLRRLQHLRADANAASPGAASPAETVAA